MAIDTKICLLGFGASELSALHALVRLMMRRGQTCTVVHKSTAADVVVANADDPETMRQLWASSSVGRVLLVGQNDGATGWPVLPRPMKLLAILDTIDALLAAPPGQRGGAAQDASSGFALTRPYAPGDSRNGGLDSAASGFAATQPFVGLNALAPVSRAQIPVAAPVAAIDAESIEQWRAAQRLRQDPTSAPTQWQAFAPGDEAPTTTPPPLVPAPPVQAPQAPTRRDPESPEAGQTDAATATASAPAPTPLADALVVGDGDLSRRALHRHLHLQGLRADLARTGEEALQHAARRAYRFVFLDTLGGEMDAFATARALRKFKPASGERPLVIMLSSAGGLWGRLRARLAGCDAFLVKPVDGGKLGRVLAMPRR
ncbi:MAG: hypothetical protein CVU30_08845 [Betaproteobacteria bacterium HGW-Betaproteobacteria-3]|nr:MAG: hypothetical protein CVU30_08845 [Betaproteobacteria bacterium HGW-Betaproteobacteria-3]